ncbi:FeoC-like transcriptional regulator [Pyrococcus abyssi]|uniref:FeoC-like transcriptional regulator n=1 Tax=Pyrococcus abyssi TaxID=29292 RepID=UPI00064EC56A|nr:FeoC-like transcriptional regulator [Pyrococcus abyssi]
MLEKALELMKKGSVSIEELAQELGITREEAEGIMKILESMGYVKEYEVEESTCEKCPLRKVCGGKCVRSGVKVFIPTFQI